MSTFVINSSAPVRICDNGGWTDTWFSKTGEIFNIGVSPSCETQIKVSPQQSETTCINIYTENFEEEYQIHKIHKDVFLSNLNTHKFQKHPLLESICHTMPIPSNLLLEVSVFSKIPPGAHTGTSASIVVSLIGAFDFLIHKMDKTYKLMSQLDIASFAHWIESFVLKRQSGIQDQLCAVFGGINYIKMLEYPMNVQVENLRTDLDKDFISELERRLVVIFLGNSHLSSQVHEEVIKKLESTTEDKLEVLRNTAKISIEAIKDQNFELLGKMMIKNNEAQRKLHPGLISNESDHCIEIAKKFGAIGYKVNGAGGIGGTITILTDYDQPKKRKMVQEMEQKYTEIQIQLNFTGLKVWEAK